MPHRHPTPISVDAYLQLGNLLRPGTRERVLAKRKRWLDGIVSPFAKKLHKRALKSRYPSNRNA